MNWDGPITRVLQREGGYSDRPEDKGGPTNRGITLKTYSGWLRRQATVTELKAMPEGEARSIYLQLFVKDTNLEALSNALVQEVMFDWMVNSGPSVPVKALQRRLALLVDGRLGPRTADAANHQNGLWLAQTLCWDRVTFIADWMRADKRDADRDGVPDSMENAAGILRRIADLGRSLA